jgi:hypothetical protein
MDYSDEEIYAMTAADADDRAAADLSAERRENTLAALYHAAMLGLPEEPELRHLCAECGIPFADLQAYTPPLLRPKQKEPTPTPDLFPF